MRPYYEADGITIYHGDCREILPFVAVEPNDLTLADPPYGMNYRPGSVHVNAIEFDPVLGDCEPFDPSPLLGRGDLVAWGANFYASRLPDSGGWIGWDKRTQDGMAVRSSEAEFAWTNFVRSPKLFRYLWAGAYRDGEQGVHEHPTQKPVDLMRWCISLAPESQRIIEPYCGTAPGLRAAKDLGRRAIGIEIEERYCEIAAKRLAQGVLALVPPPAPAGETP